MFVPQPRALRLQAKQKIGSEHGEKENRQTDAPVHAPDEHEQARDEQDVSQDRDDELTKELGEIAHVAVDAFDHLAGGVRFVKGHVEMQAVASQVEA